MDKKKALEIYTLIEPYLKRFIEQEDEITSDSFDYDLKDILDESGEEYDINTGASKGVIVFHSYDFVFKISFTTPEEYSYNYDSKGSIIDKYYYGFEIENYCELETKIYNQACEEGLSEVFAEEYLIGNINGIQIYCQEKATKIGPKHLPAEETNTEDYKHFSESTRYIGTDVSSSWLYDVFKHYGLSFVQKLINFIEDNFNDCHNGNIGYINNKPVLIDYSGFYD